MDGFRFDVAGCVTRDYWAEAIPEIRKMKPDLLLLSEGGDLGLVNDGTFDINYSRIMSVMLAAEGSHAKEIRNFNKSDINDYNRNAKGEYENKLILPFETHDSVTDEGHIDRDFPEGVAEAALLYDFTANGTPFIYNGNEIANANKQSMFANRKYGREYVVDWSWALTEKGKNRLELVRKLCKLRKEVDEICYGDMQWLDDESEEMLFYRRNYQGKSVTVAINFTENTVALPLAEIKGKPLLFKEFDGEKGQLGAYGYAVIYR